jgi:hypothetical protein
MLSAKEYKAAQKINKLIDSAQCAPSFEELSKNLREAKELCTKLLNSRGDIDWE